MEHTPQEIRDSYKIVTRTAIKNIRSKDPVKRLRAIGTVVTFMDKGIPRKTTIQALNYLAKDPDPKIRSEAAQKLELLEVLASDEKFVPPEPQKTEEEFDPLDGFTITELLDQLEKAP